MTALPRKLKRKDHLVISLLPDNWIRLVITDSRNGQALPMRYKARRSHVENLIMFEKNRISKMLILVVSKKFVRERRNYNVLYCLGD